MGGLGQVQAGHLNLKLPMKERLQAVELCRMLIRQRLAGRGVDLRLKQLHHDRAEVTGFLRPA